jgi:hypothetical protein
MAATCPVPQAECEHRRGETKAWLLALDDQDRESPQASLAGAAA